MSGSVVGGRKAAATNKLRYGENFYRELGARGGTQTAKSGKLYLVGFGANPERARIAGKIGGSKSRRGPNNPYKLRREPLELLEAEKEIKKTLPFWKRILK